MTLHEAQQQLLFQLYGIYSNSEALQITDIVMENITGWKRIDRVQNKKFPLQPEKLDKLKQFTHELLQHKPIQYVLKEAWFAGMLLHVDNRVLIPRPETEELVDWVVRDLRSAQNNKGISILDIGTGSGCIALGLKKQLPICEVHACDVSEEALQVAVKNAALNNLTIQFHLANILLEKEYQRFPSVDFIVSNPPYISYNDKSLMAPNVVDYEPHLSLYVPDNDPLLFYRAIFNFAKSNLIKEGTVYLEIHEEFSEPVRQLLLQSGFLKIEIRKDMQGKDRMVKANY